MRIGILLDSLEPERWISSILRDIQASDHSELVLAVLNDTPSPERTSSLIRVPGSGAFFNRYSTWDYERYKDQEDPFRPTDVRGLLAGVKILPVVPLREELSDRFRASDLGAIREARLDVLLRLGFRIVRGGILRAARHGVWSYHHGDTREYRGGPPLFWEIYERNPVSGTALLVLSEEPDDGKVIYRSFGHTEFNSLYQNRKAAYWKAAEFVGRRLRDLHRYGWEYLTALDDCDDGDAHGTRVYQAPTNSQMVRYLARRFWEGVRKQARRLFPTSRRSDWLVAYRRIEGTPGEWKLLLPPTGRFYADPFPLKKNGRTYLFFEDYLHDLSKGVISMVELDPTGEAGVPRVVLESDIHLSYPFIFEHEGETYMIPETCERRRIELYRAGRFPDDWTLDRVLIDNVACVDATLHRQGDGMWWLFANVAAPGASRWDELHLYFAETLDGPWTAHPKNPIVSDVRSARPAGRLFWRDDDLLRPAQDCSVRYGYAVTLNRITTLSEADYVETAIEKYTPDWLPGILGTHTLNRTDDFEFRDAWAAWPK